PDIALLSRRSGRDDADDRRLIVEDRHLGAPEQHNRRQYDGEQQVHDGAHDQHLEPLPLGLRQELVAAPGPFFFGVLAGHLAVAAERQCADAVLGVAAPEAEHRRVEAELKLEHTDADALRGEKMPELVDEHEDAEDECKRQDCDQARTLRPSILPRAPSREHTHAPSRSPRAPAPTWSPPPADARPWSGR